MWVNLETRNISCSCKIGGDTTYSIIVPYRYVCNSMMKNVSIYEESISTKILGTVFLFWNSKQASTYEDFYVGLMWEVFFIEQAVTIAHV